MHSKKQIAISDMDAPERYDYFVRKVCDFEVVWGLSNEGWAAGKIDGVDVIPVWPERELAAACATGDWADLAPKEIPLDDFLKKWLPGATADGTKFAVFPTVTQKAAVVDNETLRADIETELAPEEEAPPAP